MPLRNGWKVDKSNTDTERFHLNRVLKELEETILQLQEDVDAFTLPIPAADVSYDNTTSLLTATNAQAAIDELVVDKLEGPATSTDNTLPRFDGTDTNVLQGSNVVVSDNDEISLYRANVKLVENTSYTLVEGDTGLVVEISDGSPLTVTLPNDLPKGWCATIVQRGAGQLTFSPEAGGSLSHRQSHTKTAGQWAVTTLYVRSNSGTSAAYVLAGDTSA